MLVAAHPAWAVRTALSWVLDRRPFLDPRELWSEFHTRRICLSSIAMSTDGDSRPHVARGDVSWHPELRISGEMHEGLLCSGNSTITFKTAIEPPVRLRASCAVLPSGWDVHDQPVEFRVSVHVGSGSDTIIRTASNVLYPSRRWSDRRWRPLTVAIPPTASREAVVTLETRTAGRAIPVAWGDPAFEWPRGVGERKRLIRGAIRRLREWGLRKTVAYAGGRRHIDDQAAAYARWISINTPGERALAELRGAVEALPYQPLISIVTPVHNTAPDVLVACLESVRRQAYGNWEHCIADDGSTSDSTRSVLRQYADDPRVRVVTLEKSQHVSAASNAALSLASGEYVALLDHDDELAPEALAEVVRCLNTHRDADVIYSDEDKLDSGGARCDAYFKPDWSPELFLSYMYVCHMMVVRTADRRRGWRVPHGF